MGGLAADSYDPGELDVIEKQGLQIIDTETMGLKPRRDEVLSLTILDGCGTVLLDERFGTARHRRWDEAQSVQGISPADVKGLPTLGECAGRVTQTLKGATRLIGYNLGFDLAFLTAAGVRWPDELPLYDVMREFARLHGLRNGQHPNGRWVSLTDCVRHYGYGFEAHSSLEDARATLFCFECVRREGGWRS